MANPIPPKRKRRLTKQERHVILDKLHNKLTADELEYLNTLMNRRVEEAENRAFKNATAIAGAIIFRVLTDKFRFEPENLHELWNCTEEYLSTLSSKEITAKELLSSLWEENRIMFTVED